MKHLKTLRVRFALWTAGLLLVVLASDDEAGRLAATFDSMLARLDNAFRRERQFTADASHELRTPLSAMQTIIGSTLARQPDQFEEVNLSILLIGVVGSPVHGQKIRT